MNNHNKWRLLHIKASRSNDGEKPHIWDWNNSKRLNAMMEKYMAETSIFAIQEQVNALYENIEKYSKKDSKNLAGRGYHDPNEIDTDIAMSFYEARDGEIPYYSVYWDDPRYGCVNMNPKEYKNISLIDALNKMAEYRKWRDELSPAEFYDLAKEYKCHDTSRYLDSNSEAIGRVFENFDGTNQYRRDLFKDFMQSLKLNGKEVSQEIENSELDRSIQITFQHVVWEDMKKEYYEVPDNWHPKTIDVFWDSATQFMQALRDELVNNDDVSRSNNHVPMIFPFSHEYYEGFTNYKDCGMLDTYLQLHGIEKESLADAIYQRNMDYIMFKINNIPKAMKFIKKGACYNSDTDQQALRQFSKQFIVPDTIDDLKPENREKYEKIAQYFEESNRKLFRNAFKNGDYTIGVSMPTRYGENYPVRHGYPIYSKSEDHIDAYIAVVDNERPNKKDKDAVQKYFVIPFFEKNSLILARISMDYPKGVELMRLPYSDRAAEKLTSLTSNKWFIFNENNNYGAGPWVDKGETVELKHLETLFKEDNKGKSIHQKKGTPYIDRI